MAKMDAAAKFELLDSLAWDLAGANTPAALNYFEREMQLVNENLPARQGRLHTTRAHIYRKSGNLPKAETEVAEAIRLCQSGGNDEDLYNAFLEAGNIAYTKGNHPGAIDYFSKAQKEAVRLGKKPAEASCSNNIANIYYAQGDFAHALVRYEEARKVYTGIGNKLYSALALDNMANCYQVMGKQDTAMIIHLQAFHEVEAIGDSAQLADIAINMSVAYIDGGAPEKALAYLDRAYALAKGENYLPGQVVALLNYSEAYMKMQEPEKAIESAKQAAELAEHAGMNEYTLYAYEQLAKISEMQGKPADALAFYKKYISVRDTLFSSEKQQLIAEMSAKYETDKKDGEISELTKDKARKQLLLLYLGGGLAIVLLFSIVLIRVNTARRKANKLLGEQNRVIAEKNKDITDSITYARRIQQSVMPDEQLLRGAVSDYFILNRPRDIVSGDFYWIAKKENRVYIAVADCTGHGVPGALVSVIGLNMLNKIIEMPGRPSPSEVLELLHMLVMQALHKDSGTHGAQDGMDIGLLCIDRAANKAFFSGAARPLYYSTNGEVKTIRGDRYSIAGEKKAGDAVYVGHEIPLAGRTVFWLCSDGYADQFGEASGKKFMTKRFQELLSSVAQDTMEVQKMKIEEAFLSWKGTLGQVDDVLVAGVEIR